MFGCVRDMDLVIGLCLDIIDFEIVIGEKLIFFKLVVDRIVIWLKGDYVKY